MKNVLVGIILFVTTISIAQAQRDVALVNHMWFEQNRSGENRAQHFKGLNAGVQLSNPRGGITEFGLGALNFQAGETELFGIEPDSTNVVVGLNTYTNQNIGLFFLKRTKPENKWIPSLLFQWNFDVLTGSASAGNAQLYQTYIQAFNQIRLGVVYDIEISELLFCNIGVHSNVVAYKYNSFEVGIIDGPLIQAGSAQVFKWGNFVPTLRGSIGVRINKESSEKN